MAENTETIQESLKIIQNQLKELSKETGIKTKELLPIMANRELVIINNQLQAIHEHLDRLENQNSLKTQSKKATKMEVA